MCGRFSLSVPDEALADYFELADTPDLEAHYNIAPTQNVACVRPGPEGGGRRLDLLRWGLVPFGAKDLRVGARMINARCETVATRPAFRQAFRERRCLVAADGFYEWRKVDGRKQPVFFQLEGGGPFGFAGLWSYWHSPDGEAVETCAIVTTAANELVAKTHDRMPVILRREDHALWLDHETHDPGRLGAVLTAFATAEMTARAVSTHVNSHANDDPRCIEPLGESEGRGQGWLFPG